MANPDEIAELIVGGRKYRDWTSVQIQKAFGQPTTVMTFSAASPIESGGWDAQKLKIGDRCSATMAGVKVADGLLYVRQTAFDARQHALQVQVLSQVIDLEYATVDQGPGQFKNYTIAQIGAALTKPYGIKFSVKDNPTGADKPFPRFNVQPGETVITAITRLAKMRNLFLVGDENGNLVAMRVDGKGPVKAHLEEGRNIKSASCVISDENIYSKIQALGQQPGNDQSWGDAARDTSATVTNPDVKRHKPKVFNAEEPGDKQAMQMRADYEAAVSIATMVQAEVTVQGWHDPAGDLWLKNVGQLVMVKSRMMFPQDQMALAVQGVAQKQGPGGTETTLSLIVPHKLAGGGQINADGPDYTKANAAKPDAEDV